MPPLAAHGCYDGAYGGAGGALKAVVEDMKDAKMTVVHVGCLCDRFECSKAMQALVEEACNPLGVQRAGEGRAL